MLNLNCIKYTKYCFLLIQSSFLITMAQIILKLTRNTQKHFSAYKILFTINKNEKQISPLTLHPQKFYFSKALYNNENNMLLGKHKWRHMIPPIILMWN